MTSFLINCSYMHIYLPICIVFLQITCSVCTMLLVCMSSLLTLWYEKPIGELFHEEHSFPLFPHFLFVCSSLCSVRASWDFLHLLGIFIVFFIRLYECSFWHCNETQFQRKLPKYSGSYNISTSFLQNSLSLRCRNVLYMYSLGLGFHNSAFC